MFSSSKSKSSSQAWDNRSMASDTAIAAGGNAGSIMRDVFGDHIASGGRFPTKAVLIGAATLFVLWRVPMTRKIIKKLIGVKNG